MVANRVWTTERSSAKSRTTRSSAAVATGVAGSAVRAVVGVPPLNFPSRSSTSVVVPERVRATTRSYDRPRGNSEAANASVSPCPAASRSAAAACAMKYDVPHPTIAIRSPGAGSAAPYRPASSAARVQHSGWLFSSSSTWLMPHPPLADCSCKI